MALEPFVLVQGAVDHLFELLAPKSLQDIDLTPGQQRGDDLETGVLRGGADEGHRTALDGAQEAVLLGLGEAVNLVDEQHRPRAEHALALRAVDDLADFLDAAANGAELVKGPTGGFRHQAGQGGLSDPRRAPQDHRRQLTGLQGAAQRGIRPDEVGLSDVVLEAPWAHALGQGGIRGLGSVHGAGCSVAGAALGRSTTFKGMPSGRVCFQRVWDHSQYAGSWRSWTSSRS